jgi:hypothetical protein
MLPIDRCEWETANDITNEVKLNTRKHIYCPRGPVESICSSSRRTKFISNAAANLVNTPAGRHTIASHRQIWVEQLYGEALGIKSLAVHTTIMSSPPSQQTRQCTTRTTAKS